MTARRSPFDRPLVRRWLHIWSPSADARNGVLHAAIRPASELTVARPAFAPADLFDVVTIGGQMYEVAAVRGPVSVRLVRLSSREVRLRRLGMWLSRRGIRL